MAPFTTEEFLSNLRTKYPVYDDLNDSELLEGILTKYPVYKPQIRDLTPEQPLGIPAPTLEPEVPIAAPVGAPAAFPEPEELPAKDGFIDSVSEAMSRLNDELRYGMFSADSFERILEPLRGKEAKGTIPEQISTILSNLSKEAASLPIVPFQIAAGLAERPLDTAADLARFFPEMASNLMTAAQLNPVVQVGVALGKEESIAEFARARQAVAQSPLFHILGVIGLKGVLTKTGMKVANVEKRVADIQKRLFKEAEAPRIPVKPPVRPVEAVSPELRPEVPVEAVKPEIQPTKPIVPQPAPTPEVAVTARVKERSIAQLEAAKAQRTKLRRLTVINPNDLPQMPALQTIIGINAAKDYPGLFADVRIGRKGKSPVGATKVLDYDRSIRQNYDQIDVNAIPAEYWERYGGEGIVKRPGGELGEADFDVFVRNAQAELSEYAATGKVPDPFSVSSLEVYGTAEPPPLESLMELRAFTGIPDPKLLVRTFKDISEATSKMIEERRMPEAMRPGVDQALKAMIEHDRQIRGAEANGNWMTQVVEKVVPKAERQQLMVHAYEHKMKGPHWNQLTDLEQSLTKWLAVEKRKLNDFVDKNKVLERMEEKDVNHIFHHWINPESGQPYSAMYGKFSKGLPQAKQRTIPTYEAGIEQGLQPATTNLGRLIGMEWQSAMRAHQTRQMFASLNSIEVLGPEAGTILLRRGGKPRPLRFVERWDLLRQQGLTEGYERYIDPKSLLEKPITYKDAKGNLRIVKGPVGIRKEIYSHVRAYIEDPIYGKFDALNNAAKSLKLASMFHVVSLGAQEAANFRIPFKNIPRGLKLAQRWDDPVIRLLFKEGLEVKKGYEDVGYQTSFFTGDTKLTKFGNQLTKPIQYMRDFIFNVVQPGMKTSFTYDTFNKILPRYIEEGRGLGRTEKQSTQLAARRAVQAGDGHFSGEHWKRSLLETNQFMVKLYFLPESRLWWQRGMLSPTWQREHLLVSKRVAQSLMPESMSRRLSLEDLGPIRKEYRKYALGAVAMIGAVDVWNLMATYQMDGEAKHIWQNPEGKGFAVRAWWNEPDYTVVDKNGVERTIKGGAAYIRPLKSVFEVAEFATDPIRKLGYKLSPMLTAFARQFFPSKYQQEYKGLPDLPRRAKDFMLDVATPMAAERAAKVFKGQREPEAGILPFFGFPTSIVRNKSKRSTLNAINKLILEGDYEEAESMRNAWNRKNIEDMIQ